MADETTREIAALPENRDVAVRELWRRVFGEARTGPERADPVGARLDRFESRLDRVDDRLARIDNGLSRVETQLAVVDTKITVLEATTTRLDAAVVRLESNSRIDFRLTFGAIIATALGLAGMMAKGFHWF